MASEATDHRPWPPPARRWAMAMRWEKLAFLHWPQPADRLRRLLPAGLELDLHDGSAWLGVVPFRMSGVRPRCTPPLPGVSRFLELNVRTYVVADGKPGVWFFSLDAASRLAVRAARRWFHLPYYDAQMSLDTDDGEVYYTSRRTHAGAPPARFEAVYRPLDAPRRAEPGGFEQWLVERYCLYAAEPDGRLWRGEIHHAPWPLQSCRVEVAENTLAEPYGLSLPSNDPVAHYAERIDVVAWTLDRVDLH